jgi:hypothetical protein
MQITKTAFVIPFMVLLVLITSVVLVQAEYLKTEEARDEEVTGTFTLILYGARYSTDLETVVFLDKEGDGYEFEPYAPEFDYKVKKGVSGEDALREARKFVSFHNAFWRSQLSKILDEKGNTIGYEVRPLYLPFVYGRADLLEVYYKIKDGKVIAYIRLTPQIFNNRFFSGDQPSNLSGQ